MTDRCEPPEHLRGVDGWHWLKLSQSEEPTIGHWFRYGYWKAWNTGESISVETAGAFGYRYLASVATPEEVAAVLAERDTLRALLQECADELEGYIRMWHRGTLTAEDLDMVHRVRAALGEKP